MKRCGSLPIYIRRGHPTYGKYSCTRTGPERHYENLYECTGLVLDIRTGQILYEWLVRARQLCGIMAGG
jgi:hypothetical protein